MGDTSPQLDALSSEYQLLDPHNPNSSPPPPASTCFMSSLDSLRATLATTPCEAIAQSDGLKAKASAAMTLCDMKTAGKGVLIPRECTDWEADPRADRTEECVGALRRSTQDWITYTAYSKEIVTVCSAYRRRAELARAWALYQKSARTMAAFLDDFKTYKKAEAEEKRRHAAAEADRREEVAVHERQLREVELARFGDDLAAQLSRTDAMVTQFGNELADVLASAGSNVETWLDNLHGGLEQVHAGLAHGHALAQTSNLLAETNIRLVQGFNEQLVVLEGRSKDVAASLDQTLAIASEHQTKLQGILNESDTQHVALLHKIATNASATALKEHERSSGWRGLLDSLDPEQWWLLVGAWSCLTMIPLHVAVQSACCLLGLWLCCWVLGRVRSLLSWLVWPLQLCRRRQTRRVLTKPAPLARRVVQPETPQWVYTPTATPSGSVAGSVMGSPVRGIRMSRLTKTPVSRHRA